MDKWKQIKIKHHYVWEHYLKNWSIENKIYWLTSKKNIANDSTKGLCREEGFYKISPLDDIDLEYILLWSKKSPGFLQEIHKKNLMTFVKISQSIKISLLANNKSNDLYNSINALMCNSLENMYSSIESMARPVIDNLSKGDISILDNPNNRCALYSYLGHQITRTKAIKERFFEQQSSSQLDNSLAIQLSKKTWWFISYMLGDNIFYSLNNTKNQDKLMLVKNTSNIPFITSDSPVINIHPELKHLPKNTPPKELDIFFPISPVYALIIATSSKWDYLIDGADNDAVLTLNKLIALNAHISIYGNTKDVIDNNKKYVNSH